MRGRQQKNRVLAQDGDDRVGEEKATLEEREARLERLKMAMRDRGEDVVQLAPVVDKRDGGTMRETGVRSGQVEVTRDRAKPRQRLVPRLEC